MCQTVEPASTVLDAIEDVEKAIRVCDGNARLAVRGLILGRRQIKAQAVKTVSAGYVRRRLH